MQILKTLVPAVAGGSLFFLLNMPLPWMLGSLTAVLLWGGYRGRKMDWPAGIWHVGLMIVGYTIGSTFTQETMREIIAQLPIMALTVAVTIFFNLGTGYLTYRQTGISLESGLMGSIPGGLSQMTALCMEVEGADLTAVTFMQTARALAVVFVVPFLAIHGLDGSGSGVTPGMAALPAYLPDISPAGGLLLCLVVPVSGFLAQRLHLPTPYMLGPVLAAACLALAGYEVPALPRTWTNVAQLFIGTYTGARMNMKELKQCRQLIPFTLASLSGLLLLSLGIGWMLYYACGIPLITAFLSTAPGGIAEMSLTAIQVHADLSVIVAFQLFRLLVILLIVPPALKWWLTRRPHKQQDGAAGTAAES